MRLASPGQEGQTAACFPTELYKESTKHSFQQRGSRPDLTRSHSPHSTALGPPLHFPSSPWCCQPHPRASETPQNHPARAFPLGRHLACAPARSPQPQRRAGSSHQHTVTSPFTSLLLPHRPGARGTLPSSPGKVPGAVSQGARPSASPSPSSAAGALPHRRQSPDPLRKAGLPLPPGGRHRESGLALGSDPARSLAGGHRLTRGAG